MAENIRKTLKLSKTDYFETHYALINAILPQKMTPTEIKVVAAFMSLEGHILKLRFGPTARKLVMQSLKLSPAGLGNHISSLIKKGFLFYGPDNIIDVNPLLLVEKDQQQYHFRIINEGE